MQPAFAELVLQHITISDKVGKSPFYSMTKKYCFWIVNTQKRYYFACFICAECTFFHPTSKGLLGNTKLFSQHFLGVASLYHVGFE